MKNSQNLPSGKIIQSSHDLGQCIRDKRKQDNLTQIELAELTGVGVRFLSELENGKPTAQLQKIFQVMQGLGLIMRVGL